MPAPQLTAEDLNIEIASLGQNYHHLRDDDLFILWFLRAYITESHDSAVTALTGGAKDKGIDAALIDDAARAVFLIQGKYREELGAKAESRTDVTSFAQLAGIISDPDKQAFEFFVEDVQPHLASLLKKARKQILERGYRVWLYYVTTGRCSNSIKKEAQQIVKKAHCNVIMEVFDSRKIIRLLRDYLDGVAPPIPTLELEMEKGAGIQVNEILQRYDSDNEIESWVFSMRGDAVADLFEYAGIRLFARNIRGFLGKSAPVNRAMMNTLTSEPDHFFYFNNGITIICDKAERISRRGMHVLRVANPQIINGQQTTRVLAAQSVLGARASVLVKVIQIHPETNIVVLRGS